MDTLDHFRVGKSSVLNGPASQTAIASLFDRFGHQPQSISRMYALFDGETSWGAWIPGYRLDRLEDVANLMESTCDSWELEEDESGEQHPMRNFLPLISSSAKTSIGPIFDARARMHGRVIEYHYEDGEFRIWSQSVQQFTDAFLSFSLRFIPLPTSLEASIELYDFSQDERDFLSRWGEVVFPVVDESWHGICDL